MKLSRKEEKKEKRVWSTWNSRIEKRKQRDQESVCQKEYLFQLEKDRITERGEK